MRTTIATAATVLGLFAAGQASAQCDTIADLCAKHITTSYIPDGQFYRALLQGDELAEFSLTLFGGTTYRVAACSGLADGNLVFSVFDQERNLLFTNKEHANSPYWDLVVANTLDVTIEAQLDPSKLGSGCAVMLIGFKQ
ncbi:MAG: hypothetical protein IPJ87_09155 [Flavobacteriales bacterium]|nr:hypothetical protein [Flavobacteriales bacterium]MBK7942028.1 hypothetical protein [Flavobacteriales bacterium]MBK9700574.1 hypothetical protein [Flavobacteriales bacterium]